LEAENSSCIEWAKRNKNNRRRSKVLISEMLGVANATTGKKK